MALERVKDILKMADEANTSAIAFICIDYNMVYSVIKTAEKTNTPAIVMLLPEHAEENNVFGIKSFVEMTKELAAQAKVPIGLHLDHSYDYHSVIKAIKLGFPSVMIDGSQKSLEENIAITRKVTETAHVLGVDVEGELGSMGKEESDVVEAEQTVDEDNTYLYTSPEAVEKFCNETKVDSLTIAIGSAHGIYTETPRLDIPRLKEINSATDVPLALHGGSGIPDDQLEQAFKNGINKFNVGTEFLDKYYKAVVEYTKKNESIDSPYKILELPLYVQDKMEEYLTEKLKLSKF